jgi:hypothetical protein
MIVRSELVWRRCVVVTMTLLMLIGAGCRTMTPLEAGGLPGEEYLVGGGMMIDWKAPVEGTAYLV